MCARYPSSLIYVIIVIIITSISSPLISNAQSSADTLLHHQVIDSQVLKSPDAEIEQIKVISALLDSINYLNNEYSSLETSFKQLNQTLQKENANLQEQLRIQLEKEKLFNEKEQLYKDAVNSSMLDKVKLEGQIATKDSKLEGKEREISMLQKNLSEKDKDISSRNSEIQKIISDKERAERNIDTLNLALMRKELLLIKTGEQLKYSELKVKECESRYTNVTNKKKKMRVVQGFAVKNYRTPDFMLSPKDVHNPSVYVINNRNSSNIEFDYVTGASFMIKDLSKEGAALTYDVGFFLGFGGNNLFKNFYLGPNMKLFDVVHFNVGANIAEYEVLKDGFNVGDVLTPGTSIPTNKAWKINAYMGFTFDLELITLIGKR